MYMVPARTLAISKIGIFNTIFIIARHLTAFLMKCIIYQCIEQIYPSHPHPVTGSMLNESSQKGRFSPKPLLVGG